MVVNSIFLSFCSPSTSLPRQLSQLFSFAGPIKACYLTPRENDTLDAQVEFEEATAANQALVLHGACRSFFG